MNAIVMYCELFLRKCKNPSYNSLRKIATQREDWEIDSSGSAVDLSSASGENGSHSWLPSKGVPHDGQGSLPGPLPHTHPVRDTRTFTYTPTHVQSSAVSATRRMLSSHTQQGQDFHRKNDLAMKPYRTTLPTLSPNRPHHLIKKGQNV